MTTSMSRLWSAAVFDAALFLAIDVVAGGAGVGNRAGRIDHVIGIFCLRGLVGCQSSITKALHVFEPISTLYGDGLAVRAHASGNGEQISRFRQRQGGAFHRLPSAVSVGQRIGR